MEIFHSPLLFFFFITLPLTATELSRSADKIAPSQLVRDTETLVSAGAKFELGFFSAGNSSNRYVGIWFYNIPVKTVVWVANRDHPINGSSGVLQMGRGGNLVIVDGTGRAVWSTSTPNVNSDNVAAQLLDSGNLVLIDKENIGSGIFLWESFDHPFDTLLAGMKLGWDLRTGLNRYLTSWRNSDDPSTGDITYAVELRELPEKFLRRNASVIERGGLWEASQYSRVSWSSRGIITPQFVRTAREVYYTYVLNNDSVITRAVLNHSGMLQRWIWSNITQWTLLHELPNDFCDEYANCGPNAVCMIDAVPLCSCLTGYTPKSPQEWAMNVWSRGCVKKKPLNCPKGEVFEKLEDVKAPRMLSHWVDISMSLDECRAKCLKNCTCTAYSPTDIVGEGSGCLLWYGDLIDIRKLILSNSNLKVFIRVMASDLGNQKWTLRLVAPIVAASLSLTMLLLICFWKRTKKRLGNIAVVVSLSLGMLLPICFCRRRTKKRLDSEVGKELDGTTKDQELALLDITTIKAATDNFASTNKLGQGGFGAVYKGRLASGQEVAVKRLSKSSGQGNQEFKNEAMLIAKLQHRNLVRLLGCCISRDERMLIYEYLPNKSLDCFIFNEAKRATLDWNQRFKIILGIARGVLYLHQDSRLKIIHRDLKASNVLLDVSMNPKISDFGMAKMFGDDQIQANTNRVVGTYGYMSPEYAMQGFYSIKSDVFSFGVILLEIVSGKRTTDFFNDSASLNLIAHVWNLWNEGKSSDIVDSLMGQPYDSRQLARIIQIGLLCVQEHAPDRPTMMDIILMLGNEAALASPNKPAFILNGSTKILDLPSIGGASANDVTITELDGR